MPKCKDCFHFDVCMDYTNLKESEFAQNFEQTRPLCEHYVDKAFVTVSPYPLNWKKTDTDRWYSTKEICEYLGISRDTMLVWIAEKGMPAHKAGRKWMFKTSEVDEWVRISEVKDGDREIT